MLLLLPRRPQAAPAPPAPGRIRRRRELQHRLATLLVRLLPLAVAWSWSALASTGRGPLPRPPQPELQLLQMRRRSLAWRPPPWSRPQPALRMAAAPSSDEDRDGRSWRLRSAVRASTAAAAAALVATSAGATPAVAPAPLVPGAIGGMEGAPMPSSPVVFGGDPESTLLLDHGGGGSRPPPPPEDPVWWRFGGDGQGRNDPPAAPEEPPAPPPTEEEAEAGSSPKLDPRVYVLTKYPTPGRTKTRMIPALGSQGATILHRRLVRQTLETLDAFRRQSGVDCRIRYDGAADVEAMMGWLGLDWVYEPQGPGDLGQRMAAATALADGGEEGVGPVVLIGSDCPFVTPAHLGAAVAALEGEGGRGEEDGGHDVVLGPAKDGGYWLIGLKRPCPELFQGVDWGTDKVLAQTLKIAEGLGLRVKCLETLADLDRPDDLALWTPPPLTSVIIPVLNEAHNLPATIASIYNGTLVPSPPQALAAAAALSAAAAATATATATGSGNATSVTGGKAKKKRAIPAALSKPAANVEVIVVDGGSTDESKAIALALGARVVSCPVAHRARQMNLGAAAASGDVMLFLHGDTALPADWEAEVRTAFKDPRTLATAFRLHIDAPGPLYRALEAAVAVRSGWPLHLPYGDQALALRREAFEKLGGFRNDLPIMEDYHLVQSLHARLREEAKGGRGKKVKRGRLLGGSGPAVQLLPGAVTTSARRWERLGLVRTTLINQLVVLGWHLKVSPETLATFYRQARGQGQQSSVAKDSDDPRGQDERKGKGKGKGKKKKGEEEQKGAEEAPGAPAAPAQQQQQQQQQQEQEQPRWGRRWRGQQAAIQARGGGAASPLAEEREMDAAFASLAPLLLDLGDEFEGGAPSPPGSSETRRARE